MSAPETVKVVLLGESGVGKTSIISQFTAGKFDPDCVTSLSAQFISKIVEFPSLNKSICFDIWDTAGQEKFRSVNTIFYRDANICILVYDITRKESFESLKTYWHKTVKELGAEDILFGVAGNKIDKFEDEVVDQQEARDFASSIDAIFHLTSAIQNTSIDELFKDLGKKFTTTPAFQVLEEENRKKNSMNQSKKLDAKSTEKKKKSKCC